MHTERVENVAFNPATPHVLATGGRDSAVRVWDLDSGRLVAQLQQPRWAHRLAFSARRDRADRRMLGRPDPHRGTGGPAQLKRAVPTISRCSTSTSPRTAASWSRSAGVPWRLTRLAERDARSARESSLRDTIHWGVVIPAGDRRAIVGGFSGTVTGFDLEKMVTPTTASADELTRLAELAAGRRIMSQGSVVPISRAEWTDRWEQIQRDR